jgi:hypothetical protein
MRTMSRWLGRQIVHSLVMLLAVPFGEAAMAQPQQAEGVSPAQTQSQNSDSATKPDTPPSAPVPSQATPEQQQGGAQAPVGTAAAPYEKGIGVAASRPAGAVIAPAKQRRTRSILIKVGVIVAAGVAIGTVVGLSAASPSRSH